MFFGNICPVIHKTSSVLKWKGGFPLGGCCWLSITLLRFIWDFRSGCPATIKELRAFRKDTNEQFNAIRENVNGIGKRLNEAEGRIDGVETRIQVSEEQLMELAKFQMWYETKLDLEGHSSRENVKINGMKEGEEDTLPSVVNFVQTIWKDNVSLFSHRVGDWKNTPGLCWQIVVKLASYRIKEDIKKAWQARGFGFQGTRIHVDNDYAPEIQRRRAYVAAKKVLKENNIHSICLSRPVWECTTWMEQWRTTRLMKRLQTWWREDYG